MLKKKTTNILSASRKQGWVLEPDAKQIMKDAGISVPRFKVATKWEEAESSAEAIGFPLVCKVVSPKVIHKSDSGGVILGVDSLKNLKAAFHTLKKQDHFSGMLMEETLSGLELIIGAKMDYQFGPVILMGMGGTGVEVYNDMSIRMAPIVEEDVLSMMADLKAHQLLDGFRGKPAVNRKSLTDLLIRFSDLIMALAPEFESIDLNPVMCTQTDCIVADARIILKPDNPDRS